MSAKGIVKAATKGDPPQTIVMVKQKLLREVTDLMVHHGYELVGPAPRGGIFDQSIVDKWLFKKRGA